MEKKVKNLSLQEKFDVIKMISEDKKTVADAVSKFKCGKTQIYTIMKEKDKIIDRYMTSSNVHVRKGREGNFSEINKSVFEWFLQASAKNAPTTGPILQAKAKEMAKLMNIEKFSASNGWLQSFKKKYGITCKYAIQNWLAKLKEIIRDYEPKNIGNACETALFYRAMPNWSEVIKDEKCSQGQFSKERLTILLTIFADGRFEKPWVVGKYEKPRCFKNIKLNDLPVEWKWNPKALMTVNIFEDYLTKLNSAMKKQNRNILLFVDNSSCHQSVPLSNVKLIFFPPSKKSVLQPLDNGIIQNIKNNYRRLLLKKESTNINMGNVSSQFMYNFDILDAVSFLHRSVKMTKEEKVRQSFKSCGFLSDSDNSIRITNAKDSNNVTDIQDMINYFYTGNSEGKISAASYVDIDKDIATEVDLHQVGEALEVVVEEEVNGGGEDFDLAVEELPPLNHTQVFNCIKALKEFGKVKGDQEFFDKVMDLEICFNSSAKKNVPSAAQSVYNFYT